MWPCQWNKIWGLYVLQGLAPCKWRIQEPLYKDWCATKASIYPPGSKSPFILLFFVDTIINLFLPVAHLNLINSIYTNMLMEVSSICMLLLSLIPAAYYFLDKIHIKKSSPNETKNFAVEKPNLPPGSNGWPLIGESLDYFSKLQQGLVYNFLSDRWKKYSSDTFRTSLIGEPMMIFSNAEGNKFLYSNEKKLVQVWWPSTLTKIFPTSDKPISQHSLTIHKIRHLILKPDRLREYVGIMDAVMKEHLQTYTTANKWLLVIWQKGTCSLYTIKYSSVSTIQGKLRHLGRDWKS